MPAIRRPHYDASVDAVFSPARRPGVVGFSDQSLSVDALCAELSRLVYLNFELSPAHDLRLRHELERLGLTKSERCIQGADGTQAIGVRSRDGQLAVLVFRGTEDAQDHWTNFQFLPEDCDPVSRDGGWVHRGFAKGLRSVSDAIQQWLEDGSGNGGGGAKQLVVTGHSLGAALATVAASRWYFTRLVTFGSPRVGNSEFVRSLRCAIARYVNCCDFVASVPPAVIGYEHAGAMRYIDRQGRRTGAIGAWNAEWDRLRARLHYPLDYGIHYGNVPFRDLADHAPINYVRALL